MKRVLSFLLMIVFTNAQVSTVFAKSGGPDLVGSQNVDTIGTFAGVMIPESESNPTNTSSSNSIGLFSLGVPDAGMANGAAVIFVEGTAFNGTITGVADPLNGTLVGIFDATSTYVIVDPITAAEYSVFAQGNVEAEIRETASINPNSLTAQTFSFATTRIEGNASIDIFGSLDTDGTPLVSNTAKFIVDGFKQSSSVVQASIDIGQTDNN